MDFLKYPTFMAANQRRKFSLPLLLACVFIWVGMMLWMDRSLYQQELQSLIQRAEQQLTVYQITIQKSIDQFEYLPAILASDPRVIHGLQESSGHDDLSEVFLQVQQRSDAEEIFLMDTTGMTIASANYLSPKSFVNYNYAFRPYFQSAIQGQSSYYFAVGVTSGQPGLFLAEPVQSAEGIIGVVVVKLSLSAIEQTLAQSGDKIWLTDQLGIVFLSYDSRWLYRTTRPISETNRHELAQTRQYADSSLERLPVISQHSDFSRVLLDDDGEHIVFQQDLNNDNWKINWLFSEESLHQQINVKKLYASSAYLLVVMGLLWLRERHLSRRTERKLHEQALNNDVRQRALIDSTDAGLINMTADGQITFINAQARQLFRLDYDSAPEITDLISPWRGFQASIYANDAVGIRSDGTHVPLLVSTSPVGIDDNNEYLVTVHDVSELKQTQQELQRSHDELEQRIQARTEALKAAERELFQSQQLAAIGRMSSAIAHELNQPITALTGYVANAKRLAMQNPDTEQLSDNLAQIGALTERLSYISRQLRLVSGKRNSNASNIRILPIALYAQDVLLQKSELADVRISIGIGSEDQAFANSALLEQVLVNLLSFAIEATVKQPVRTVTINGLQAQHYELRVHNSGHALTDDDINNIFEPFYYQHRTGDRLDLGLAISYNLISEMNGKLTVQSSNESGTTFVIQLPLTEEQT